MGHEMSSIKHKKSVEAVNDYLKKTYTRKQLEKLAQVCRDTLGSVSGCQGCAAKDDCDTANRVYKKAYGDKDTALRGCFYLQDIEL